MTALFFMMGILGSKIPLIFQSINQNCEVKSVEGSTGSDSTVNTSLFKNR